MFVLIVLVMFPITPPTDQLHEASSPTFATIFTPIFSFPFPSPYHHGPSRWKIRWTDATTNSLSYEVAPLSPPPFFLICEEDLWYFETNRVLYINEAHVWPV